MCYMNFSVSITCLNINFIEFHLKFKRLHLTDNAQLGRNASKVRHIYVF